MILSSWQNELNLSSRFLFNAFIFCALFAFPFWFADGQVALDAVSYTTGNTASLTWSHTVGSGSDRILLVGVSIRRSSRTVASVRYSGLNFTRVGYEISLLGNSRVELWSLLNPPTGSANVVVTLSSATTLVAGAISYSGVNQTTPMGTFTSAYGFGTTASVNVSSAAGEVVVDVAATAGGAYTLTRGAGQTTNWSTRTGTGGGDAIGASSREAGAASVTMSWTLGYYDDWVIGAVPLRPVTGPNMVLSITQDYTNPPPGTNVVYTVNYSNSGDAQATSTQLALSPPAHTSLVPNSVILNNVAKTDAADADEVTLTGSTITVTLGTVLSGGTGTVKYTVQIQ